MKLTEEERTSIRKDAKSAVEIISTMKDLGASEDEIKEAEIALRNIYLIKYIGQILNTGITIKGRSQNE